jgi:hypothetical protein
MATSQGYLAQQMSWSSISWTTGMPIGTTRKDRHYDVLFISTFNYFHYMA